MGCPPSVSGSIGRRQSSVGVGTPSPQAGTSPVVDVKDVAVSVLSFVSVEVDSPAVVLAAMGQAFFSVGVGGALMVTYGSFLSKDENIGSSAAIVAGTDTLVAVVAGLMIFPIVFANNLDPAAGAQLIFDALPAVFADMPGGQVIGGLFFLLAFIAALTTSIAILMALSVAGEEQLGLGKKTSAFLLGALTWAVGCVAVALSEMAVWIDFLSGSVLLPLGGLLVAVFVGWVAPRSIMRQELRNTRESLFRIWRFFIRYLGPLAVGLTLLLGIDAKFDFGLNDFIAGLAGGG